MPTAHILGLTVAEFATVAGLVVGPLSAVGITLWVEGSRRVRERRMQILRAMVATLKVPGDPNWSIALNTVLLEFHRHGGVVRARREYIAVAGEGAPPKENEAAFAAYIDRFSVKQVALVYQVAKAMGFSITEGELRTEAYIAAGLIARDQSLLDSYAAMREIATNTRRSAVSAEEMMGVVRAQAKIANTS